MTFVALSEQHDDTAASVRLAVAGEVLALMGRHRVSQKRLAEAVGMTQQSLSRRLTADVAFDIDDLDAIARYFNRSIADLLGGSDASFRWSTVSPAQGELFDQFAAA